MPFGGREELKIKQLQVYHIKVPFKMKFGHAKGFRDFSENIVVKCVLADGTVGFGEGVPREYVTGETVRSAMSAIMQLERKPLQSNFLSFEEVAASLSDERTILEQEGDVVNNAALSALELSILDAFGGFFQQPLHSLVRVFVSGQYIHTEPVSVMYSAVLSSGGTLESVARLLKFRLYGFKYVKVKVGTGSVDVRRVAIARKMLGKGTDIRLDANGAWSFEEAQESFEIHHPAFREGW